MVCVQWRSSSSWGLIEISAELVGSVHVNGYVDCQSGAFSAVLWVFVRIEEDEAYQIDKDRDRVKNKNDSVGDGGN